MRSLARNLGRIGSSFKLARGFCILDEQLKASLPWRLGGIYAEKNEISHRTLCAEFGTSILKESAAQGFVQAYDALADAIAEEDDVFIREVCEPVLADNLLSTLTETKKKGLRLVKTLPASREKSFTVHYNKLAIHAFQPFDRKLQTKAMPMKTPLLEFFLNLEGLTKKDQANLAVMTVTVEFDTNVRLQLVNRKDGQPTEITCSLSGLETHRLEFAIPRKDFMQNVDFKSLVNFQSGATMRDVFSKLLAGDKYDWFVYDIDDFMRAKTLVNSN